MQVFRSIQSGSTSSIWQQLRRRPWHEPTSEQQVERQGDGDDSRQENTDWCNQPGQVLGGPGYSGACEDKGKSTRGIFSRASWENVWCGTSLGSRKRGALSTVRGRLWIQLMMKHRAALEEATLA